MWQITARQLEELLSSEDAVGGFIESRFAETMDEDDDATGYAGDGNLAEGEGLYLGKVWHLLHCLLTGEDEGGEYPLAHAIMIGYIVHESWDGLTYLPPDQVKDVAMALSSLAEEDLRKACDSNRTSELEIYKYPSVHEEDVDEALEYFYPLREYYQNAAKNGNAMLRFFH